MTEKNLHSSAGLSTIFRDQWGIPHIYAETDPGCAFGFGYAQAQDHLSPMLENFILASGRASEFMGDKYIAHDIKMHSFDIPAINKKLFHTLASEDRKYLDAFAAGINRYINDNPHRSSTRQFPVNGEAVHSYVKMCQIIQQFDQIEGKISSHFSSEAGIDQASNAWTVRPERTLRGETFLLGDPHLPWEGPFKWYEAHLCGKTFDVYGVTLYGLPAIMIGFSSFIAWTICNNDADLVDVYAEKLNSHNTRQYRYNNTWRNSTEQTLKLYVRTEGILNTVQHKIIRTHHGPVVKTDTEQGIAYAVRITGLNDTDPFPQSLAVMRAGNLDAFIHACSLHTWVKFHIIACDVNGNIGYLYNTLTHERNDGIDWKNPVDGSISDTEWGKRIPFTGLPKCINPSSGYLQNCNNSPFTVTSDCPLKPADFPKHLSAQDIALSSRVRGARVMELIESAGKLTLEKALAITMDVKALTAREERDFLIKASMLMRSHIDPDLMEAVSILENWNLMADTENRALPLLTEWVSRLHGDYNRTTEFYLAHAGDEKVVREALAAFYDAVLTVKKRWGKMVTWGDAHILRRGNLSLPCAGTGNSKAMDPFTSLYMTGARRFEDNRWICSAGSSWIMLVSYYQGKVTGRTIIPYGNSDDQASSHYNDQAPLFSEQKLKQVLYYRDEVEKSAKTRFDLRTTADGCEYMEADS